MTRYWMWEYIRLWRAMPEQWRQCILAALAGGLLAAVMLRLLGLA